jgi:hypothetical protein
MAVSSKIDGARDHNTVVLVLKHRNGLSKDEANEGPKHCGLRCELEVGVASVDVFAQTIELASTLKFCGSGTSNAATDITC